MIRSEGRASLPGRVVALAALAGLAGLLAAAPAGARPHGGHPSPGAPSIGDPLFPGLGNGGYDVRHYTLALDYHTTASVQTVPALERFSARATQSLSRFDLDFSGDSVSAVWVNRRRAHFTRDGSELVITPRRPIRDHRRFTVRVAYASGPQAVTPEESGDLNAVLAKAWFATPSGSITAAQPSFAHRIFPSNDVPSDPATYTIRALTPAGSTFVANGELTRKRTFGGHTLWSYEEREPMASELIQLAFGALTVRDRGFEDGVHLRDVAPTDQIDSVEPALLRGRDHLDYMTAKVGRYPFRTYGSFFSDATFPFALEDQTISLYPTALFLPAPRTPWGDPRFYEPIMVHELAHQWYGDDVTPARWSDVWLNEGHATWYEWEYAQERGDPQFYLDGSFDDRMRAAYAQGDQLRATYGPVAAPKHGADDVARMFSPNVYDGGALVLYALRQVVGDPTFRQIERRWPRRFGGGPASTADFIAFASHVSHRDLSGFLGDWLYGTKTPPMPGHPDWTVDPVASAAAHSAAAPRVGALQLR
jgi:aminopeptidase N